MNILTQSLDDLLGSDVASIALAEAMVDNAVNRFLIQYALAGRSPDGSDIEGFASSFQADWARKRAVEACEQAVKQADRLRRDL